MQYLFKAKSAKLAERPRQPIVNVFLLAVIYKSFIDALSLNLPCSKMLSIVTIFSFVAAVLNIFKIKSNTTLISLYFITLIIGTFKTLEVFLLSGVTPELYNKVFYGVFISLTFLIVMNNLSNRNFDTAISFNCFLAIICSSPEVFEYFDVTVPERLYDYIPVFFLILNLLIYMYRSKPVIAQDSLSNS